MDMDKDNPVVFVVDDDEAICESLRLLIGDIGLEVRTFTSARQFLEKYDPPHPGCLVLDVRMSGMSGLELQSRLIELGMHIPTIIITGHADVPMAVEAMKAGAMDFIEKPFRDQVLLDSIQKADRPGPADPSPAEGTPGCAVADPASHPAGAGGDGSSGRRQEQQEHRIRSGHQPEDRRLSPGQHPGEDRRQQRRGTRPADPDGRRRPSRDGFLLDNAWTEPGINLGGPGMRLGWELSFLSRAVFLQGESPFISGSAYSISIVRSARGVRADGYVFDAMSRSLSR